MGESSDLRKEWWGIIEGKQSEIGRLTGQLKELTQPQITAIMQAEPLFMARGGPRGDQTIITAWAKIENSGAPSFISDFTFAVTTEQGKTVKIFPIPIPPGGITLGAGAEFVTAYAKDNLPRKAWRTANSA